MSDIAARRQGRGAQRIAIGLPFPAFPANFWSVALTFNADCYATLHDGFLQLSREWQDFVSGRMTEDFALLQKVGSVKSFDQAWATYVAFWQKAAEDYAAEYGRATKLAGSLASQSMATLQRQMEAAASEITPFERAA